MVYGPQDRTRAALIGYLRALGFEATREPSAAGAPLPACDGIDLLVIDDTLADAGFEVLRRRALAREVALLRLTSFNRTISGLTPGTAREQTLNKPVLWRKLEHAVAAAFTPGPSPTATLPRVPNAAPPPAALRGRRVLLVEDNVVNQALAIGMLETYELEVDCAENGREALEKLDGEVYALVLMDCQMPEMDGLEATRRWRAREAKQGGRRVPIVALTANAMAGDREDCLAAGMDGYLAKPFNRAALAAVLNAWMAPAATREIFSSCPSVA